MFAVRILGNDYLIADGVGVVFALGIFPLVVLTDKLLLPVFNVLPVGFEANVVDRIAIEHKLRRRGSSGSMYSGSHREANCGEDPIPGSVG